MTGRLVLLLTSPRVASGLLSREAWQALEAADVVLGHEGEPQVDALRDSRVDVEAPGETAAAVLGRELVRRAAAGAQVVWVGSSDGDPGLTDVVAAEVSRLTGALAAEPPEVEVLLGSHDVPGARLLDLVAVMDRLRSPGGCPWDREQTHTSLVPYLVEEAHEAAEALESGDRDHMVEELGDVLLQVAFHARVAEEDPEAPFDIDDVAAGIVAKLVRRHPHVFADGTASTPGEVETSWDEIKAAEKDAPEGSGPLGGVPAGMPPLARATKVASRLRKAGLEDLLAEASAGDDPGARLLALVAELTAAGSGPGRRSPGRAAWSRGAGRSAERTGLTTTLTSKVRPGSDGSRCPAAAPSASQNTLRQEPSWPASRQSEPGRSWTPAATPPSRSRSPSTTGRSPGRRSPRVPRPVRSRRRSAETATTPATSARAWPGRSTRSSTTSTRGWSASTRASSGSSTPR